MPLLDTLAVRYALVLVLCGVLGVGLGINRTIKRREKESLVLQVLSAIGGLVVLATPTVMVLHIKPKGAYTAATLLLMIVLSLCLLARPLKKVPIAFITVTAAGVCLLWAALKLRGTPLRGRIPIEFVIGATIVVLAALFVLAFAFEAFVDTVLSVVGLGLVVTIVSTIALIHGALIAKGVTGPEGLQLFLR
ncbi:MAG: hypothetical protein H6Q86_1655 [candidate division NC10 bacterium]|nr:hypothetical protein [candidate division NC10 bacterium]